jgi:hypothetical protein
MKAYSRFISEIRSHSHILNETAFRLLMSEESLTRVLSVAEDRLKIEVIMTEEMKRTNKDYYGYAFVVSASFLVALNIAALGHFSWTVGNGMLWHCEHVGPSGKSEQVFMKSKDITFPAEKRLLTEAEVRNSVIIAGSLMRDNEQDFRREYLKGIIHLGSGFGDLTFGREAFANFYRAFEYFVTSRVLVKKKLANELKDLREGIRLMGLPEEFCAEFAALYKIRSEQVMHAQRSPKDMDIDDVIKIKVFTDYALHKYYRSKADQWLTEHKNKKRQAIEMSEKDETTA